MTLLDIAIRVANLKSFGLTPQGFDVINNINVLVGRNNSGKSALIDLVKLCTLRSTDVDLVQWHKNSAPAITIESTITADDIRQCFPANTSGGPINGDHYEYGRRFQGNRLTVRLETNDARQFMGISDPARPGHDLSGEANAAIQYIDRMGQLESRNPLRNRIFVRLNAERDISPESDDSNRGISENGAGITNAIQRYLNKADLPRDLVRVELLSSLNRIFNPDTAFEEITCRQISNGAWEIFLVEKEKGLIALSQSGSGLKTVIATLSLIHLFPHLQNQPLGNFVMAFEELENNLHPALQRRLLSFVAEKSIANGFPVFLTTHSSIAIDLFNKQKEASIYHVTHDGVESKCTPVKAYIEHRGILDDLDVRASDLLQANGIIWVEGPSDRVHLNNWIRLYSDGVLVEGNHYQCVFYGGRLLSHLSAEGPKEEVAQGISIIRVNRNAALIIDSDKRATEDELNATKRRVISEIEEIGGMAWVTAGREIENCVPFACLQKWAASDGITLEAPPGQFESVFDYLDKHKEGYGKRLANQKALLAESLGEFLSKDDLLGEADTAQKVRELCALIRQWNRLPEPTPPAV